MANLPKVPQRGDSARLQQLASGLKMEHGTYGATVQRNNPGRPTGTGKQQAQGPQMPGAHAQEVRALARTEWVRQFWAQMTTRYPDDPRVQMHAANSERIANARANAFQQSTPFFEY